MKPGGHIATSGILGLVIYTVKGDSAPALSCFMAGWLVDLDHVFDWVYSLGLRRGILTLTNVYNNFACESFDESKGDVTRIYLFLHSWEIIFGFWGLYIIYPVNPVITCAFLGFTLHLFLDQVCNGLKSRLGYFFTYRVFRRFEHAALYEI